MKIFIVMKSSYSVYHIVRVFNSGELAKNWINNCKGYKVEEYEIEECISPNQERPVTFHHVTINKETGHITNTYSTYTQEVADINACLVSINNRTIKVSSPISHEHAIKVAIEERQKWLREKFI